MTGVAQDLDLNLDLALALDLADRADAITLARFGALDLRVVVDTSSVEVFAADGRVVLTNQVFPAPGSTGLTLVVEGAAMSVPLERTEGRPLWTGRLRHPSAPPSSNRSWIRWP